MAKVVVQLEQPLRTNFGKRYEHLLHSLADDPGQRYHYNVADIAPSLPGLQDRLCFLEKWEVTVTLPKCGIHEEQRDDLELFIQRVIADADGTVAVFGFTFSNWGPWYMYPFKLYWNRSEWGCDPDAALEMRYGAGSGNFARHRLMHVNMLADRYW